MRLPTLLRPPLKIHDNDRCYAQCPEGRPCNCKADVRHVLHICSTADCACHSQERYENASRQREKESWINSMPSQSSPQ